MPTVSETRFAVRNFGNSISLDGSTSYIALTQTSGIPLMSQTNFTISAWVFNKLPSSGMAFYSEGNSATANQTLLFGITATTNGLIRYLVKNDANTTLKDQNSTNIVPYGKWAHVAVSDANGTVHVYVNGVEDPASVATSFNYTRSGVFTMDRASIGALVRSSSSNFMPGLICDVRLFDSALTQDQINQVRLKGTNPVSPVGWYLLNEGTGTSAIDSSQRGNTGTITAGAYSTNTPMSSRSAS